MDAPAQRANAAAAIAALRALDLAIADAAIIEGVRTTRLPARLQAFVRDDVEIVIDVAHNPQAARQLAAWLTAHPATGATLAVFSALGDKDLDGIVAPLIDHIAHWWLCGLHDTPRGLTGEALAERLRTALDGRVVDVLPDVELALRAARASAVAGDRILVFGSFHTAADALRALDTA
jgi:dihydrofolate synthase/folylpolyglutamate synthase